MADFGDPYAYTGSAKGKLGDFFRKVGEKSRQTAMGEFGSSERYLPPELRGLDFSRGLQGIGEMIRHPGQLSPTALSEVQPRLNSEFRNIGQNYENLASEQAGAAARGNVPVSIKNALQKALGVSQQRARGEATNEALMESDQLRRADLDQTYNLLDSILQYISSGRGQAIPGLSAANAMQNQAKTSERAGNTALIGSLLQGYGGSGSTSSKESLSDYLAKTGGMI